MLINETVIQFPNLKNRKPFYNDNTNYDFFIIYNNKIFYLHQKFLSQSVILYQIIKQGDMKFFILNDQETKSQVFEQVLKCLYGFQITFQRNWEILPIFNALHLLQIQSAIDLVIQQLHKNYDDYGFFLLLSISVKFQIQQFKEKCIKQLIFLGFQQLNYNFLDFLQCQFGIAKMVIELYIKQYLKKNSQHLISLKNMKKLIKKYYKYHNLNEEQSFSLVVLVEELENNKSVHSFDNLTTHNTLIYVKGCYFEDEGDYQQGQLESAISQQKQSRITYLANRIIMKNRLHEGKIETIRKKKWEYSARSTNNTFQDRIHRKQREMEKIQWTASNSNNQKEQFSSIEEPISGNIVLVNRRRCCSMKNPFDPKITQRKFSFQQD